MELQWRGTVIEEPASGGVDCSRRRKTARLWAVLVRKNEKSDVLALQLAVRRLIQVCLGGLLQPDLNLSGVTAMRSLTSVIQ